MLFEYMDKAPLLKLFWFIQLSASTPFVVDMFRSPERAKEIGIFKRY
jgi:hypothetical protein